MKKIIFFLFLFNFSSLLFSLNFVSADIISINAGGSEELVINPNNYLDGFFSCIPDTCSKLGYACGEWANGCGRNLNCGTCPDGYTCSGGICTGTSPGGGGGGGGDSGGETIPAYLFVTPSSINLTLSFNNQTKMSQRSTQNIYIVNNATTNITLPISQVGLDNVIILGNSSVYLKAGESKTISVDFIAPFEERDFNGSIKIGDKKVSVYLHVTSNPLWFDSNIVVLNKDYKISQGDLLKTRVELVPMGEKSRLDVTLNYVIKDMEGKIYLTKSETVLVEQRTGFERNFDTGMLPLGKYVVYLDLIYPGGVAPSSAHFDIIEKSAKDIFGIILFILVILILLIAMLLIFFLIMKRRKKEEEESDKELDKEIEPL